MTDLMTYQLPKPGEADVAGPDQWDVIREAISAGYVKPIEVVPHSQLSTGLVDARGILVGQPLPHGLGATGLGSVLASAIDVAIASGAQLLVLGQAAVYAATVGGDESATGELVLAARIADALKGTKLAAVLQSRHEGGSR